MSYVLIIFLLYFLLITAFIFGWIQIKYYNYQHDTNILNYSTEKKIFLSVIIALRNEEANIATLIHDLLSQTISNEIYEVILIDDNSDDDTYSIIENKICGAKNFNIHKMNSSQRGKKEAINMGVKLARGDLIVTTDADCRLNPNWLKTIYYFYITYKPKMIIAPVLLCDTQTDSFFGKLQELEFMSLQASAAGAIGINMPLMCNGANLIYEKEIYMQFNDALNNSVVSGDDMFLLLKIKKLYPKEIRFLKHRDAIVTTTTETTLRSFLRQRFRWTSKSRFYRDPGLIYTSLLVLITNISLLIILILVIVETTYLKYFILLFLLKTLPDFILLFLNSFFYKNTRLLKLFIILQILYSWYIIIVGVLGNFVNFSWKKRKY